MAQVYQELYGELAEPKQAMTLGTDTYDYDVYVIDDDREKLTRQDVKDMVISAKQQDGTSKDVKLSEIASFEDTTTLQSINHFAQNRYMSVTAEI